jgi:shikimate kinase
MSNLLLIGYRCTGKTTTGRLVAQRLNWRMRDADDAVEEAAGRSIHEMFEFDGESYFRDLEVEAVGRLVQLDRHVISLGGGVVLREENRLAIQPHTCVWLRASIETIWSRMTDDDATLARRPALTDHDGYQEIEQLLALREPLYQQCADFSVNTDGKTPDGIADEIVRLTGGTPEP